EDPGDGHVLDEAGVEVVIAADADVELDLVARVRAPRLDRRFNPGEGSLLPFFPDFRHRFRSLHSPSVDSISYGTHAEDFRRLEQISVAGELDGDPGPGRRHRRVPHDLFEIAELSAEHGDRPWHRIRTLGGEPEIAH